MGIALGLTNVMLRNLTHKGYIRATRANWKSWVYNLTPEGFSHKFKLTIQYVYRVLDHYKNVRQTLGQQLEALALHRESRVAIYGATEFAELIYLGLKEVGIDEVDIFDPRYSEDTQFLGMPVRNPDGLASGGHDRVLIAFIGEWEQSVVELAEAGVDAANVVAFFMNGKTREDV